MPGNRHPIREGKTLKEVCTCVSDQLTQARSSESARIAVLRLISALQIARSAAIPCRQCPQCLVLLPDSLALLLAHRDSLLRASLWARPKPLVLLALPRLPAHPLLPRQGQQHNKLRQFQA